MAFVIAQASKLPRPPSETPGPGAYQAQFSLVKAQGTAPFCSAAPKRSLFHREKTEGAIQPGPGHYQPKAVSKPSGRNPVSKAQRFVQRPLTHTPGPCDYQQDNFAIQKQLEQQQRKQKFKKMFAKMTQIKKVQQTETLEQQYQLVASSGVPGPGAYDLQTKNKRGCVRWVQTRPKSQVQEEMARIVNGHQEEEEELSLPHRPFKQSHMFASTSKRQAFKPSSTCPSHSYLDVQQRLVQRDKKLSSNFGSKSKRGEWLNTKMSPGPGQYELRGPVRNEKESKFKNLRRPDKNDIKITRAGDTPGPGYYEVNCVDLKQKLIKKYYQGYKGRFCSSAERFEASDSKKEEDEPELALVREGNPDCDLIKNKMALFRQSALRGRQRNRSQNRKRTQPDRDEVFGKYYVNHYDLYSKIKKEKQFKQNLEQIRVNFPAFGCGVDRFKYPEPDCLSQLYPLEQLLQKVQESPPQARKGPSQHFGKAKRFAGGACGVKPGVGEYQYRKPMEKQSFNVRYGYRLTTQRT